MNTATAKTRCYTRRDSAAKVAAAAATATVSIGVLLLPYTQWFTHFSHDLLYALRPSVVTDRVLIVYLDDNSRIRYQQPLQGPWKRGLHLQLLKQLEARNARAVVFDVLFSEPTAEPSVDVALAALIRSSSNVVLAARSEGVVIDGQLVYTQPEFSIEPIGSAAPWGVTELPVDVDGIVRCHNVDTN